MLTQHEQQVGDWSRPSALSNQQSARGTASALSSRRALSSWPV